MALYPNEDAITIGEASRTSQICFRLAGDRIEQLVRRCFASSGARPLTAMAYDGHSVRFLTTRAFAEYGDMYSDGVETSSGARWLHTAGQVALRADGSVPATFAEQCEQALDNLVVVLDAAGMTPADIVKLTCYVVGAQDLELLYATRRARLEGSAPAATLIVVQALAAPELLVEIEAVAAASDPAGSLA